MPTNWLPKLTPYILALTTILLVLTFKLAVIRPLDADTPFMLFYAVVVVSTWYGGVFPGVFSAMVCTFLTITFFLPPYNNFLLTEPESLLKVSVFLFETTIIIYLVHSLRKVREPAPQVINAPLTDNYKDDALLLNMIQITAPIGMCFWDRTLRYVRINPVMAALSGLNPAAHIGRTVEEMLPQLSSKMQAALISVLDSGIPVLNQEIEQTRHSIFGDTQQHFLISYYRVRNGSGETFGVGAIMLDITDRKKAEEEKAKLIADLQRRREQLDFLVRASEILNSSLDYETTLRSVAEIAVPTIADWCAVDILQPNGQVERLAVTHIDPTKVSWAYDISRKYPPKPDEPGGVYQIIRSGVPELYRDIPDELLVSAIKDPEMLAMFRGLGLKSAMNLPLLARGRGVGMLQLVMAESGRHYTEDDFTLGQELASRAAIAIDNAQLFREATQLDDKKLK